MVIGCVAMSRRRKPRLTTALWEQIEPLLPALHRPKKDGQQWTPNQANRTRPAQAAQVSPPLEGRAHLRLVEELAPPGRPLER